MKNLYTRTITGIFFVAIIIGSMILHPLSFTGIIYVIMVVGMLEFFRTVRSEHLHPQLFLGLLTGTVVFLVPAVAAQGYISPKYLVLLPVLIFALFVAELFRNKSQSIHNLAFTIFPVAYISIPLTTLVMLTSPLVCGEYSHWHIVFSFFIISWSYDTFAYLTGMAFGRHKFFERISPKKTWEGTFGGIIFGLIAAYILSLFFIELSLLHWLTAAFIIMVTGVFGDLSESLLKRKFNVKDSGNFFPGHGGVLDRFDAVLFSAPAFFCYLILLHL